MNFRFLQFPRTSLEHTLSDSGLDPRVPDLALLMQPIPLSEAGNENAYPWSPESAMACTHRH